MMAKSFFSAAICLGLLLISSSARSQEERSIFFTDQELSEIDAITAAARMGNPDSAADRVHLGAIIYSGPNNWRVWLQGNIWTPETNNQNVRIIDVTPQQVRISLASPDNGPSKEITLRPHQTYIISIDQTIEGN
ncbi:MAG: hypothetical protein PHX43_01960 [Alphaproteobacteria bacterium]|nr:hypothetical protein [Alphaproteobacteria bacterium]